MTGRTVLTAAGLVTIRPTELADAEAYRALRLEALQLHPTAYSADHEISAAQPSEYWRDMMRAGAGGPAGITYVAEAAGQLVGMTRLARGEGPKLRHSANIYSVYVRPAWRNTGVAPALVDTALDWVREQGVCVVKLGVVATNAAAIRLYLRCGFSVYGVEPEAIAWDGQFYDELLMVRRCTTSKA